jgi:Cu2+-exporting ATPase
VRVEEVRALGGFTPQRSLALAATLEGMSEHPIARAFLASGETGGHASGARVFPGEGLEGHVDGARLRIGARAFASGLACDTGGRTPTGDADDESWVYLGGDRGLLAAFRLTDPVRAEAGQCIADLAQLGLESEIVSGDGAAAVARIAARCSIEQHHARLAPEAKLARVRSLQAEGVVVVAVGDGINDAPLLRGADVAVAMGRGSALAQTSADLILVRDSLDELPATVRLARRTQRVVRQNLTWSVAYNLAALPAAALGFVPPWLAAIGMSLSSVAVVLNAMRLSRGATSPGHPAWPAPHQPEAA